MKKEYSAPRIFFESFQMSTNIAGDCEGIVDNPTKGVCGVKGSVEGLDLFVTGVSGCVIPNEDSYTIGSDTFCYHSPTEYNNLFNS